MVRFLSIALAIMLSLGALAGSPCRCDMAVEIAPQVDKASPCSACPTSQEKTAPAPAPMGDCPPGMDCCEIAATHATPTSQPELPAPAAPLHWTPQALLSAQLPVRSAQPAPAAGHVPKSRALHQLLCIHRC